MNKTLDAGGKARVSAAATSRRLSGPLDLFEVAAIFRRRLGLFLGVFAAVALAGVAATLLAKPQYTATTTVRIDPNQTARVDPNAPVDRDIGAVIETEIAVARSRQVAEEVTRSLNLYKDPEFSGAAAKAVKEGRDPNLDTDSPNSERTQRWIASTAGRLANRLFVARSQPTYLVTFSFSSEDAQKAATIANAFAQQYIVTSVKLRMETMQNQAKALEAGLNKLSEEANRAGEAAANYRAQTGIMDASGGTVTQQQASAIASQLSQAEGDLAIARSNLAEARRQVATGGADSVVGVMNSPVIQDLRGKRAEVVRQRDDLAARYGPKHPDYLRVQQQLDGIEQQINQESSRVLSGLQATASAAEARVSVLRGSLSGVKGQLAYGSRQEAVAQNLDRDAQAKQNIYNQYNLAQQQANQQKTLEQPQGVIITAAIPPSKPSFPNKPLFGMLSGVLGMIMGIVVVFLAEYLDPGLLNARDTEKALQVPVLSSIPLLSSKVLRQAGRLGPESYAVAKPMSAFAEAFRAVRSALVLTHGGPSPKVICITSALPNEGKSTSTLAFSRVLGLGGSRVVVVDCDLRRSTLGKLTQTEAEFGLIEVLTGAAPLERALVKDAVDGVVLLPLSGVSFSPEDVLGSEAFGRLLADLRARFDFVVLDTPPVLAVADARIVAAVSDAVLFLCRWSKTPRAAAASALALLDQDGANVAGVILNMVDFTAKGTLSIDDPSYYRKAYEGYYVE